MQRPWCGADGRHTPATVTRYEPPHVALRTAATAPGILVLADAFAAGWEARVDGDSAPILHAGYLFRGVALDGGPHEVTSTIGRPRSVSARRSRPAR